MSAATGLPSEITRAFDDAVVKHTDGLFEALDLLAQKYDLRSNVLMALFRERVGDLEDGYSEWISEGWEE